MRKKWNGDGGILFTGKCCELFPIYAVILGPTWQGWCSRFPTTKPVTMLQSSDTAQRIQTLSTYSVRLSLDCVKSQVNPFVPGEVKQDSDFVDDGCAGTYWVVGSWCASSMVDWTVRSCFPMSLASCFCCCFGISFVWRTKCGLLTVRAELLWVVHSQSCVASIEIQAIIDYLRY